MRRCPLLVVVLVAAVAAAVPSSAGARTIPLHWTEHVSLYNGHLVMRFRIESLTMTGSGWRARIGVENTGDMLIGVTPRLALLAYQRGGAIVPSEATWFRPALPSVLAFRQNWHGTIGGRGVPPGGSLLRFQLGDFWMQLAPQLTCRLVTRHGYRFWFA